MQLSCESLNDTLGFYQPRHFSISLASSDATAVPGKGQEVRVTLTARGLVTLWHEYTHFLQSVSTLAGIAELLSWFDIHCDLAKDRDVLTSGGHKAFKTNPATWPNLAQSVPGVEGMLRVQYFRKDDDVRFSAPDRYAPWQIFIDGAVAGIPSYWMKVPLDKNHKSVRITRSFFAEAMARAVGDLASGAKTPEDRVALSDDQVVYYALRRFLAEKMPDVDPVVATIVIADACLFSEVPFVTLKYLETGLAAGGVMEKVAQAVKRRDSIAVARQFNPLFDSDLREFNDFIDSRIESLSTATGTDASRYVCDLWRYIKEALNKRAASQRAAEVFVDKGFAWEDFTRICTDYGCPVVTVEKEHIRFAGREELCTAWLHFSAGSFIFEKYFLGQTRPCRFMDSPACAHPKKGSICETDPAHVPPDGEGRVCLVGNVAASMSLR